MQEKLVLNPGQSKMWGVSPGVVLFYDELVIDKEDLNRIRNPKSSFDVLAKGNINYLETQSNFKLIESDLSQFSPFNEARRQLADVELGEILDTIMVDKRPGIISAVEVRNALYHAYRVFLNYNKWKYSYLSEDEPLKLKLKNERFDEWKSYLVEIKGIKNTDFRYWLKGHEQLFGVASNLISVSRSIIDMSIKGYNTYDSLYDEFRPWIEMLIKKDVFAYNDSYKGTLAYQDIQNLILFELQKILPKYTTELTLEDFLNFRIQLTNIRKLLSEQRIVWKDLHRDKIDRIEGELRKISMHIRKCGKQINWPLYALSLFVSLPLAAKFIESDYLPFLIAAFLGLPKLSKEIEKKIINFASFVDATNVYNQKSQPGLITNVHDFIRVERNRVTNKLQIDEFEFWT